MPVFAGCCYRDPPHRYGAQKVEDLSEHALNKMQLTGLPIKESHGRSTIGKIVDEWQDKHGSKYISFDIADKQEHQVQIQGLKNGLYSHLSLSHRVGTTPDPLEVSICHNGKRPDTVSNCFMRVYFYF